LGLPERAFGRAAIGGGFPDARVGLDRLVERIIDRKWIGNSSGRAERKQKAGCREKPFKHKKAPNPPAN
jgi:hypothetical protein